MRRTNEQSKTWLAVVLGTAVMLAVPAFAEDVNVDLVPLQVVEAPATVTLGDGAGNVWVPSSPGRADEVGQGRQLRIARSGIAEYTVRLTLQSQADADLAGDLGVSAPHLGTEDYDVTPDVLQNLRAAKLPLVIVGGVTEIEVVPADSDRIQADEGQVSGSDARETARQGVGELPLSPGESTWKSVGPNKAAGIINGGGNIYQIVPDHSSLWAGFAVSSGPSGAEVTDFEYQIMLSRDHDNDFWADDYDIYLSSTASGGPVAAHNVWNNLGSSTDDNLDDDAEDDQDIFLNYRSTSYFNGQTPNQSWYVYVIDRYSGGIANLYYFNFRIYWQTDPVSAGDFAAVDLCGAQPGTGPTYPCSSSFSEGQTVVLVFKFTYTGADVTSQAALQLDNFTPMVTTPTTFHAGNWIMPVNYNNATVGTHRLRGYCDYYDAVGESNEGNNNRDEPAAFEVTSGGGGCTFSISPSSVAMPSGGGSGSVTVTAGSGCTWSASSNATWLTITSGSTGVANGSVGYSVASNSGGARSGTMTVAGQTFTVNQDGGGGGGCSFSISPSTASFSAGGGSGSVAVTAGSGCAWSATSNVGWITITSGANGSGNGAVGYSVASNSGGARSGTMTVAGQTFTVNQSGSGGGGGTCTPNATTLCLNNDRFQVQVNWATNQPSSGVGQGVELTSDTGYFTFFNPSNVEMVIKVLNGCSVNGNYWVFAGGLTNVQVSMTVTDTANGTSKTYNNPMGTNFQPIQDTGAFSTCP